jgi:hypothetical protein
MKYVFVFIAALAVSACATVGPAAYGPADAKGFGYEETRIESDRYRITYKGSGDMPPEQVEDYARLRAAELALANGYDWFRVIGRDISGEQRGGVGLGLGAGGGSYGGSTGVGVGVSGDLGTIGGKDYFTVRMEVLLGSGEIPEDGGYFSAREIVDNFGPRPE